jgi:hypothetical protein
MVLDHVQARLDQNRQVHRQGDADPSRPPDPGALLSIESEGRADPRRGDGHRGRRGRRGDRFQPHGGAPLRVGQDRAGQIRQPMRDPLGQGFAPLHRCDEAQRREIRLDLVGDEPGGPDGSSGRKRRELAN